MKRFYRSRSGKKLAGLCGGLAEILDVDPTLLRLGLILTCFVTGVMPVLLTYLIAWVLVPLKPWTGNSGDSF